MALDKKLQTNIDNSDPTNYPNGAIRDNSGAGDGTPVDRSMYSDIHEFFAKLMRKAKIAYSGLPDNETNGYQLLNALEQFSTKNTKIHSLSSISGVINISTKLGVLTNNEFLIAKAGFDLVEENTIKGTDLPTAVILPISFEPSDKPFKSGDYLRLTYNGSSIVAIRLADATTIDALVAENLFLKAATELEEYAAATQLKATTPYTNALAFARRVIGLDSSMFLANTSRNGIYPKEHWDIVNGLGSSKTKNIGWVSGIDWGGASGPLPTSGGGVTASIVNVGINESTVTVVFPVAMDGLNYYVRLFPQSEGTVGFDDDGYREVFRPLTANSFSFTSGSSSGTTQSLKYYFETVNF